MEQGAVGLSTGLYYAPGSYSSTEEVVALSKVAARYGGIYTSHIRDESDYTVGLVAAVKEAIEIGEKAGLPVQVSHLKALGKPAWGKSAEILGLIDAARARGVDVAFDQYPYAASGVGLIGAAIPRWAQEGGDAKMKERLSDPASRERVLKEMASSIDKRGGPEKQFVAVCAGDSSLEGKSLAEIGRIKSKDPMEASLDLLLAGRVTLVSFNMLDDDLIRIMRSPTGIVGSDGSIVEFGKGVPHPRYYGTFPRVLGKYVREEKVLSLEEAVRKMSSAPAARIGLTDRGLLKAGMAADVTLFNPSTVADTATFQNPHQYPAGIEAVIVNGQIAILGGEYLETRAGRVLYRNHASFRAPAHAQ
jgi:N-acyl-D-aspartate/D-glutamate deacylase